MGWQTDRYRLCSCVAVALLAGCGGSQPPSGAPGAMTGQVALRRPERRAETCPKLRMIVRSYFFVH